MFRKSNALSDWSSMEHDDHFVELYESEENNVRSVAEYLFHGLTHAGKCVAIATPEHLAGIAEHIRNYGFDLDQATKNGNYLPFDAYAVLAQITIGGEISPPAFEEVVGGIMRGLCSGSTADVRAFGEMVAILVAEGRTRQALELEQLWNELKQSCCFSLYCSYPLRGFHGDLPEDLIELVCAAHTKVLPGESYSKLLDPKERAIEVALLQKRCHQLEIELASRKLTA